MEVSSSLARLIKTISFELLSEEVIERTKYLALDYIALAARGSSYESTKPILTFIKEYSKDDGISVIGQPLVSVQPHYAALANGVSAHSLELDDLTNDASTHPAVVVFPTAFAIGEKLNVSGKSIIEAAVVGYEVMGRLGQLLTPATLYENGFHPTGVVGAFAAVATAGKLMHLSEQQLINAFGIVGSQTAASMEFIKTGSWTKRLHPGWAAHTGIIACELAKNGFNGPKSVFEGEFGFANTHAKGWPKIDGDLAHFDNSQSVVLRTSTKPHACCRYKQGPLDIILSYARRKELKPEEVKRIDIYLLRTAMPIVAQPEEVKRNPQSAVDAQFSMHFGAAVSVLYKNTLLEQYSDEIVGNHEVRKFMEKVYCHHDERLDKEFPQKWPARVVIETDEEVYEERIEFPKGDPENPLTWNEMIEKFNYVSKPIFHQVTRDFIVKEVRRLEKIEEIHDLTNAYKGDQTNDRIEIKY